MLWSLLYFYLLQGVFCKSQDELNIWDPAPSQKKKGVGCRRPTPGWKLQPPPPFRCRPHVLRSVRSRPLRASRRNRRPSATAAGSNPVEAAPRTTTLPSPRRRHEPPYIPQAPACPALPSVPSSSPTHRLLPLSEDHLIAGGRQKETNLTSAAARSSVG